MKTPMKPRRILFMVLEDVAMFALALAVFLFATGGISL